MFLCYIVSFPNLWQFDLKLVIHVILLNFYSFVSFDQLIVDFHSILLCSIVHKGASQMVLVIMVLSTNGGELRDAGSNPGLGRSPGGGHDNSLQSSFSENPVDRWRLLANYSP